MSEVKKQTTFEAWEDEISVTLSTPENIERKKSLDLFEGQLNFLHTIIADTYEEAMAVHHIKMGWDPYMPQGESSNCPKCNSIYYPKGSGECPKCGKIC